MPSQPRQQDDQPAELQGNVPVAMMQQAEAAAASQNDGRAGDRDVPAINHPDSFEAASHEHDVPPPAYGEVYGSIDEEQDGFGTKADISEDGRVNIRIDQRSQKLSSMLVPALRHQQHVLTQEPAPPPAYIPPSLGGAEGVPPPPPMNVVIHVVGSRGDVQPFVALGKVLKDTYGHRVRLATHPNFKDFVTENGLEFFSIGGDPAQLMAFMVKNPGLMPGFDTMRNGDVGSRRKEIAQMIRGCWRSCYEAGDGSGPAATDKTVEGGSGLEIPDDEKPFVADAIIANPPSFAHIHCAEKLGIPLHIMFTMPYSPTQAFPHPLANIQSSNTDTNLANYMSYALVEAMTFQGLGDIINRFRQKYLGLDEISLMRAPGMLQRQRVPHTYCWSPALIPKPKDWGQNITISGFFFLNLASNYTPDPELKAFLDAGPPPVYIGFGSIVLDDPNAMTKTLFEAVRKTGQRALVSKGWGGMGADELGKPDNVYMLGNVPHDWLFQHVSAVVHHGGAGTTAAGITAGKPTLVVPFFGDQPFWGAMVARAGAGPEPIPHKKLTADNLADGINVCLKPESQERAKELANKIAKERGSDEGAKSFHQFLDVDKMRCSLSPSRAAVWRVKRTEIGLSAMAACTLANEGLLSFEDLKLFRSRDYEADEGPTDPISGGATAIVGTFSTMMMGVADMPIETLKALKIHPDAAKASKQKKSEAAAEAEAAMSTDKGKGKETESSQASSNRSSMSGDTLTANNETTPAGSRSGSAFNFQESLSKMQSPTSPRGSMANALQGKFEGAGRSRSGSRGKDGSKPPQQEQNNPLIENAMGTGKGVSRIVGAGFKSPMDFTMNLTRGFRNAPKLYGDDTVRKPEQVTDFKSGVRAATKEFGFGMYDGISGLVTQPMKGAQKEGAAGFIKGFGKGIAGIALKPGAAIFGIPGYTMKGMYKELQKQMGASVQNYIIAARTAQGYDEWTHAHPEERADVVARWQLLQRTLKKKRNPDEVVKQIFEETRRKRQLWADQHPISLSRSRGGSRSGSGTRSRAGSTGRFAKSTQEPIQDSKSAQLATEASIGSGALQHASTVPSQAAAEDRELEEAIRLSVQETSNGNPEEDATIERAIRASMSELARSKGAARQEDDESEALRKAMAASLQDHQRSERDDELERALAESLKEQRAQYSADHPADEEDEELQRAIDESQYPAAIQMQDSGQQPPKYDPGHVAGTTREEFEQQRPSGGEKTQQERDEERIVLEYVKKQSLLEQQHRAGGGKGESSASASEKRG